MKIHRFIGDYDLSKSEVCLIDPRVIKQIRGVLRIKVGGKIVLSNGRGREEEFSLTQISKDKITCQTENMDKNKIKEMKQKKQVNLYLAILKKENFELAVQKAVECGVSNIIPVVTERTIKTGLNTLRLEKIILEACEQSGQNIVPKLFETMTFDTAVEHARNSDEKIIFHTKDAQEYGPDGSKTSVRPKSTSIFIGPEGGFTDKEIALASKNKFTSASLGDLILRGETAAIVATYRAVHSI